VTGRRPPVVQPVTFAPVLASIPLARNFVLERLSGTAVDHDVALLLTSELVTNAIRHARTSFAVEVGPTDDGRVQVSVSDASPEMPRPMDAPPEAQSGRGLFFVDRYATAWGIDPTADGKRVWFALPCDD